jgi:hypothetical protein
MGGRFAFMGGGDGLAGGGDGGEPCTGSDGRSDDDGLVGAGGSDAGESEVLNGV